MICSSSVQPLQVMARSSDGSQSSRVQSGSSPVNSLMGGAFPLRVIVEDVLIEVTGAVTPPAA